MTKCVHYIAFEIGARPHRPARPKTIWASGEWLYDLTAIFLSQKDEVLAELFKEYCSQPFHLGHLAADLSLPNHQAGQKTLICIQKVCYGGGPGEKQGQSPQWPQAHLACPHYSIKAPPTAQETCFQDCNDRLQGFLKSLDSPTFRISLLTVGNPVCLVMLCLISARRDKVCPLYRVFKLRLAAQKLYGPLETSCVTSLQLILAKMMRFWLSYSRNTGNYVTILQPLQFLCYHTTIATLPLRSLCYYTTILMLPHYNCDLTITFLMLLHYNSYVTTLQFLCYHTTIATLPLHSLCYYTTILMLLHYNSYVTTLQLRPHHYVSYVTTLQLRPYLMLLHYNCDLTTFLLLVHYICDLTT